MEICAFENHISSRIVSSRAFSSEYSGDAHRLIDIANGKVVFTESMLFPIKSNELLTLIMVFHNDMTAVYHIRIEAMKRLTVCHHYIISNIYNIINRTKTYHIQLVLKPIRRLLHLTAGDTHARITLAGFCILDCNLNRQIVVVHRKSIARRTVQTCLIAISAQPSIQVARNAIMRKRIGAVGSDVYLDNPIALKIIIFCSRLTNGGVFRQHDNTVMACSHADFILRAYHSVRLNATQLRFLYNKFLIAIVEYASQIGHNNFLAGCHIRRATHDLRRSFASQVNSCNVQMITIRMNIASKNLTYIQSFQSTFNALNLFERIDFKAARCQSVCDFLRRQAEIHILLKPFI